MSREISVSVIIPTFNRRALVLRAIDSVLGQTCQDFELLVCDDGSTDGTREAVLAIRDPRIRWLSGAPSGRPAVPRNRGIAAARGEWLALLDSDDLWLPEKLQRQLDGVRESGHRAVCCNATVQTAGDRNGLGYFTEELPKVFGFEQLLQRNLVICSSMLLHRSLLVESGGFPEDPRLRAVEDYALWLAVSLLAEIRYLSDPLVIYRDEPAQSLRGEAMPSRTCVDALLLLDVLGRAWERKLGGVQNWIALLVRCAVKSAQCVPRPTLLRRARRS